MSQFALSSFVSATALIFCLFSIALGASAGDYTQKERNAIDKVRDRLGDILYKDYMKDDAYILPWLKARGMNVDSAVEMIKKSHKWRIQNQMDTVVEEKEMLKCDTYYPVYDDAVDREGRPILMVILGEWDVRKYVLAGKQQQFVRCLMRLSERQNAKLRKMHAEDPSTRNITQWAFISDLKGYNLRSHACVNCLATYIQAVTLYEANYPLSVSKIFLLNMPSIFDALLQLVRPVMSPQTRDSLHVFGLNTGEWKAALYKEIAPDQLFTMHGGTRNYKPHRGKRGD